MSRLAILILTRNEETHIEACIKSASFADEIVIVDSGSTDRTQAIAESLGAKFVTPPMGDEGFAGQRNCRRSRRSYVLAKPRALQPPKAAFQTMYCLKLRAVYNHTILLYYKMRD